MVTIRLSNLEWDLSVWRVWPNVFCLLFVLLESENVRYFTCKKLRYLWDARLRRFVKLQGFEDLTAQQMYNLKGLSRSQQVKRYVHVVQSRSERIISFTSSSK